MASSQVARRRVRGTRSFRRARAVAGAVVAATALPLISAPAVGLATATAHAQPAARPPLALSVTAVNPSYATPGRTITLKGQVWNSGRSLISGLSVRLSSSAIPFTSETALEEFASGTSSVGEAPVAAAPRTISRLRARHSVGWRIRLPVTALRLSCFGVYPMTVTVTDATGTLTASEPVPMPFWPDKPDTCAKATRPTPFPISWIWPLIDSPHQGPCPGLLDNTLATSLAPGGRLAGLLAAGGAYSAKARLTWAIDPALLDNARTMSQKYPVGDSPSCTGATTHPADTSARAWLAGVTRATTGQPVFVTPYADVDVAGLARYGDKPDLQKAFSIGQQLAAPILHRDRVPATIPAGPAKLSAVAWPAGGHVSPISLGVLGAMKIGTVILAMPPSQLSYTPGAVTTELDGVGTKVTVLLGDYSLSKLLASGAATSRRAGTIFGVSQLFLAETAMIVAEAPAMQRPMVVTPPRRWNPAGKLAGKLLADTVAAPWLRTSTVGQISARPQAYPSPLVQPQARGELPGKLLRQLTGLDSSVSLLQSIMLTNDSRLSRTVFGIESSRWAGADPDVAQAMLATTRQFIANQFAGLSVGGQHVINVTLGGRVGSVTVSIRNSLGYAVRVGLKVSSSNNTVTAKQRHAQLYVVQPHSSTGLKLSVNATQTGKATVKVSLMSRTGILLPNPPDKPLIMRISATNLGTVALVIFAAALAVFVVASAAQALRRGGPGASQSADQEDPPVPGGPADAAGADTHEPEDDAQDSPARLDRTDNVVGDRSELSSVGRRPVEESR